MGSTYKIVSIKEWSGAGWSNHLTREPDPYKNLRASIYKTSRGIPFLECWGGDEQRTEFSYNVPTRF
jgi:hypothetical protein